MIVQTGLEAHLTGRFADQVEALAHGAEGGVHVRAWFTPRGRKHHQVARPEALQKAHGFARAFDDRFMPGGVIRRAAVTKWWRRRGRAVKALFRAAQP